MKLISLMDKYWLSSLNILGGTALYEYLLTYILTPEQLKENSYPLPHPTEKDKAVISGAYANRTLYCNDGKDIWLSELLRIKFYT